MKLGENVGEKREAGEASEGWQHFVLGIGMVDRKDGGGRRMDPKAEYGGSAGNWTRTGQDWMGAVNLDRAGVGGLSAGDAWAAVMIALGGVVVCGCAALLCWRWRAGRAVEVAVTY